MYKYRIESIELVEMTDDVYFSNEYTNYVSNSRLSLLNPSEGGSIDKFVEGFKGDFNPSFIIGTAIHELVLQPDKFELAPLLEKPSSKAGAIADYIYARMNNEDLDDLYLKACEEFDYYKTSLTDNRLNTLKDKVSPYLKNRYEFESVYRGDKELIYLDDKSYITVTSCLSELNKNSKINDILNPCGVEINHNEDAIIALIVFEKDGREYPIRFKLKMDNFTYNELLNHVTLNDLKSTGRYLTEFNTSFYEYRYFRQIGMYMWFLLKYIDKTYGNIKNTTCSSNIILTSTVPDYRAGIKEITNRQVVHGVHAFSDLVDILVDNYDEIEQKGFKLC